MNLRALLLTACVLALLLGTSLPAHADYWYEHYARAEKALDRGEWELAVSELNEALARKGDSGARSRSYGMNVVAYFPYLKLGIAYLELGHTDAALQAFGTERELGAIADDRDALDLLERYEQRARDAETEAAAEQQQRVAELVRSNLDAARRLAASEDFDAAIEAVGRALAVDQENSEAQALLDELRGAAAAADQHRQDATRAVQLVEQARRELQSGRAGEAARRLREALALDPTPATRALLDQAETKLRNELAAERDQAAQRDALDRAVEQAQALADAGQVDAALIALQPVLAAAPEHAAAADLNRRLLTAERDAAKQSELTRWLTEAAEHLEASRTGAAMIAANRALVLDAGNPQAVAVLARAYRQLGEELLGDAPARNLPPAIRFVDLRQPVDDGSQLQLVEQAPFQLSGVVVDRSPATVEIFGTDDQPLPCTTVDHRVGEVVITDFTLRRSLQPGRASFRVVATDDAGLSSSAEYGVLYRRPVLRSPWLRGGALCATAMGIIALVASRTLRRRRLRRRRFNPFIAGAPVLDTELFFGRDALIERVLETVHSNSLLLHGERRIGKTSLQHQLKRRLEALDDPDYRFFPVYVDLQGTPEARFFLTLADDVWQELGPLLDGLEPHPAIITDGSFGYRELVAELRQILRRLTELTSKKVKLVLLIDEVDELNAYDPRINQRLRSLFMKSFAENLVAVVSGVEIRRQWELEGSPWYNFFEEVEVSAIDRAAAADLVRRPLAGIFTLEDGAVERIVELSGCKPYQVQRLCVAVVNRLHDAGRKRMTVADVDAVAAQIRS